VIEILKPQGGIDARIDGGEMVLLAKNESLFDFDSEARD
jgi:hypothetical protein